ANRSIQASLLNSSTAGNNIALENPCGTSNNAPIGRDNPCTKQTDAFEKAIPPCKAPSDTCSLAYTSRGFSLAVTNFCVISFFADNAIVYDMGCASRQMYASIECLNASTRVAPVTLFGADIVNNGSPIATTGKNACCLIIIFS